jgi:hypothetical protein
MKDDAQNSSPLDGLAGAAPMAEQAAGLLDRLAALPGSQSVGPLYSLPKAGPSIPPAVLNDTTLQTAAGMAGTLLQSLNPLEAATAAPSVLPAPPSEASDNTEADSIVARAATVLDEEMAKGVMAAHKTPASRSHVQPDASLPMAQQLLEVVGNLNQLLPAAAARTDVIATESLTGAAAQYPILKPKTPVTAGATTTIRMTLRNGEAASVHLSPAVTDLLGTRGGRIAATQIQCDPQAVSLDPQQEQVLTIQIHVPQHAAPGNYTGTLVVTGLDYLIAAMMITVSPDKDRTSHDTGQRPPGKQPPVSTTPSVTAARDPLPVGTARGYSSALPVMATGNDPPRPASPIGSGGNLSRLAEQLAADGELGNSDAIALLQQPHNNEEVHELLARYSDVLTERARQRLTLEAYSPLPANVDNQRYEPIFDRYPVSGRTVTLNSGEIVLNEIQYYNGEMVQLFGECQNIAEVEKDLAGSGYKPLLMKHDNGEECAIGQLWAHQLTDTSLYPYNAAFLIVVVVPEDSPNAYLRSDASGVATVLPMLNGHYDQSQQRYLNHTSLFFVRLLDSTRLAIDVGRERMGTDKRPGSVNLSRSGNLRHFSVKDGQGRSVAELKTTTDNSTPAFNSALASAAQHAGMALPDLRPGTETIYPCIARIEQGPVSHWQWRSDVAPRLHNCQPDAAVFNQSSDEGNTLIRWGFTPRVCGYLANVRGVVTGVDQS